MDGKCYGRDTQYQHGGATNVQGTIKLTSEHEKCCGVELRGANGRSTFALERGLANIHAVEAGCGVVHLGMNARSYIV